MLTWVRSLSSRGVAVGRSAASRRAALALCATGACAMGMVAATAQAGPGGRPFRATIEVTESIAEPPPGRCQAPAAAPGGTVVLGEATGTGTALHLGQVSLTASDCVTVVAVQTPQGQWVPVPVAFQEGQLKLLAANGDEVYAAYGGRVQPQPDGSLKLSGQYQVTGGTGRFSGATGSGTLTGSFMPDVATGINHGFYEASGTLQY
jgi:hypothetical protein